MKERAKRGFQPFMEEGALASNSEQNVPSARPICFVAAKDEFDPFGYSYLSLSIGGEVYERTNQWIEE